MNIVTIIRISDADMAIITVAALLGMAFMTVKAWFHFKYLKLHSNKFEEYDSLVHLIFHPITMLQNIPALLTIFWVPVFFSKEQKRYTAIITLCYVAFIVSWIFLVVYVNILEQV